MDGNSKEELAKVESQRRKIRIPFFADGYVNCLAQKSKYNGIRGIKRTIIFDRLNPLHYDEKAGLA